MHTHKALMPRGYKGGMLFPVISNLANTTLCHFEPSQYHPLSFRTSPIPPIVISNRALASVRNLTAG